ncbi:MAG TPA: DUF4411 family protein [Pyrinomonadaceae bacterium]|nr:DUF4411 family protein [Pyrinomonadaceae bacterium]
MKHKIENIYCIDTSALITMQRYYPLRMLPDLWKHLEELFINNKITSHEFVFDEIVPSDKKAQKDDLATLIAKYKNNFKSISKRQAQLVPQIISTFPHLIDPRSKKDQADPWIIAMVIEMMEEVNLFDKDSDFVIISTESEKSSNKIPAVCKHYKVRHMNLFEFFEDNGWQFSLLKKQ